MSQTIRIMRILGLALAFAIAAVPLAADLSYVYMRDGRNAHVTAGNVDIDDLGRITRRFRGTMLWVEVDGKEHIIRDPAALAEIERAFEPVRALSPQVEALQERMKPLDAQISQLEERIDELSDKLDEDENLSARESRTLEERMRGLERELRGLERRMRELERDERRLDRMQDEREEDAERELEAIVERVIKGRG
jgi:prefoldin subunit 5